MLAVLGALRLLDAWAERSRTGLWVRSLLSIYDAEDLLKLDVPWWTFASSDLVARHLEAHPGAQVFEWGSGASTRWLAARAGNVTSVEHDAAWADVVRGWLPPDVDLRVVPAPKATASTTVRSSRAGSKGLDFGTYVAEIDQVGGVFDLVVIDGRAREACLAHAVRRLAPDGVILFDNVDRRRYVAALAGCDIPLDVTWTRGLTPSLPYPTRTALIRLAAH